jgi:subtilisin family serine protease
MKNALYLTIVVVLIGVILFAGTAVAEERPAAGEAPPLNESTTEPAPVSHSISSAPQQYTVTASNSTVINESQLAAHGEVGIKAETRIEVTTSQKNATTIENISWVTDVQPAIRLNPTYVPGSSNGSSLGVEEIHQSGVTGDGVKIGVIDSAFDISNPTIQDNVVGAQSYVQLEKSGAHGTSVAEIITRTAPESDLYLVSARTELQVERAFEYLITQNVDIIVASWGYVQVEDDGDHFLTDDVNRAQQNDILFVASAGNSAQTHWEGEFQSTDGDVFHEWEGERELNCLPDCNSEFAGGPVTVYIKWEDQGQSSEYQTALYNPIQQEYIAYENTIGEIQTNKYAKLSANIQSQAVDLVVRNTAGPADDEIEVIVSSGPRQMQYTVPESSISAPGDVPSAFTVAAYEVGPSRIAPYSSQGPTDDGRRGIDVTGYTNIAVKNGLYGSTPFTFGGTSAAAPYVGGVAALIEENQAGDSTPTELATTLRGSSDDILYTGADTISGAGVVNAIDSVNIDLPLNVSISPSSITVGNQTDVTVSVKDESGAPVTDASVEVTRLGISTATDSSGEATLSINADNSGEYNVSVSAGGFTDVTKPLTVRAEDTGLFRVSFSGPDSRPQATNYTIETEVINEGNATSTQTVTYNLKNQNKNSIINKSTTIEKLDAGGSTTLTFEVSASETANLSTGTYTHVVASDNDNATSTLVITEEADIAPVTGNSPPTNVDSDAQLEDVNGDGKFDIVDVSAFFQNRQTQTIQNNVDQFDFNNDGSVNIVDVNRLFIEQQTS